MVCYLSYIGCGIGRWRQGEERKLKTYEKENSEEKEDVQVIWWMLTQAGWIISGERKLNSDGNRNSGYGGKKGIVSPLHVVFKV